MPIDTSGMAFPKPGHKSGQVKLSAYRYKKNKRRVWLKQGERCGKCHKWYPDPNLGDFHHPSGRGLGGGKRDDREGVWWCNKCHRWGK